MLKKLIFITLFLFSSSVLALNVDVTYNGAEGCNKKIPIYLKGRFQTVKSLKSEISARIKEENRKFDLVKQRIYCGQGQRELDDREIVGSCSNGQGGSGIGAVQVELKLKEDYR
ncbi:MAG: hypothetical protein V4471_00135 [Pseudomonadota bacterium]